MDSNLRANDSKPAVGNNMRKPVCEIVGFEVFSIRTLTGNIEQISNRPDE